jgi:phage shock protein E
LSSVWVVFAVVVAFVVVRRLVGGGRVNGSVVLEKIKAGAKVVDVRSVAEFRSGAYPGAVNIPVQELDRRMNELPRDLPIVVYCASGGRSAAAERMLRANGFPDVVNGGGLFQMPR